jgi:hypothetical protein
MKALFVIALTLIASVANASDITIKCSNSDGTVNWISDANRSQINLKYSNFIEGILTLELDKVVLQMDKELPIDEKSVSTCSFAATKTVYAAFVKIIPADKKYPSVLSNHFPANEIETEVICTKFVSDDLECPEAP